MWVNEALGGDWTVEGPRTELEELKNKMRPCFVAPLVRLLKTENKVIHSPSVLPSRWVVRLNSSDVDIANLHWVQDEMLSIEDIGQIKKPLVWTLHDMYAFCGAEHYTTDYRWRDGYLRDNRPTHESGFDLNRWVWKRKFKRWKRPVHIITPSKWLEYQTRKSALMRNWPVTTIPNPIDTDQWKPVDKNLARDALNLPSGVPLLLFGAMGGSTDPRKGFHYLLKALEYLQKDPRAKGLRLVVLGQREPRFRLNLGFPIHYTGHLRDDFSLRAVYSAVDVMSIPSLQDNLPNTGVEALACATPVVAFHTCGLPDIVSHKQNGYLAKPFDTVELAHGIGWVLDQRESGRLSRQARATAELRFAAPVVAKQYIAVYEAVKESHSCNLS